MPKGELFFRIPDGNWVDMYDSYGISFSEKSLSLLMTPAPNKAEIENKSRLQHGKRVVRKRRYVKKDERNVDMEMHLTAPDKATFWQRYNGFCQDYLDKGFFDIAVSHVANNNGATVTVGQTSYGKLSVFRMTYRSCVQFSEFMQQMAIYTLRLNEPDPSNRGGTDAWDNDGAITVQAEE